MAKSKYETNVKDKLILIEGWARNGLTDEQIAKNLGISKTTFYKYIKEHNELSERLKKGKEVIDFEVENALLKRALGYEYEEVTRERKVKKDARGNIMVNIHGLPCYEMVVTKTIKKEVNPDTTAQIFWLKNRKPKEWRDKQDIEHSGGVEVNNPYKKLSTEELKKLAALGDKDG
ncbi:helix-turn-helix domain-containing protein [Clostridium sp. MB40-C1]|uniref:helix-turn-helix transcriptional regulator n=1 Tax=Clostridium sp. MB40-C1 TaxID=3070996 RepID=UPI0027DF06DB|nr:helix-turn-helix domain-containing protein [Clostridium sp. MB40-C1]WMJ79550.1 helix-turn-helix domain-containing protein [Clostridium sp. MB40-C1]